MINPGDKVIVEAPTFLATIQCFRLYGAHIIGAPVDADGVDTDKLEALIVEHKPKLIYLIPTFSNPSGATLSLARRKRVLELAVKYNTTVVEDDPYGELYFDKAPQTHRGHHAHTDEHDSTGDPRSVVAQCADEDEENAAWHQGLGPRVGTEGEHVGE